MATLTFKTTIKCGGCIAAVKPHLDSHPNVQNWEVNTDHPDKLLAIETNLSPADVSELLGGIGYKAVLL